MQIMPQKAPFPRVSFLGIDIHQATMDAVLRWMEECIGDRKPRFLCTLNAALLVWSRRDPFLRETYRNADLATADSAVVHYALKLLGEGVPEPLEACQIMFSFIRKNYSKGYKFYFLGSKEEVLNRAIISLRKEFPGIEIVGHHHGYFGQDEEEALVRDIRESKADCLFVGMSSPLKERFLKKYLHECAVPVSLGVGGGIDILAGEYRLAPPLLRKLGLAWFYRLLLEPRRMWKRYLTTNLIFIWLFLNACFQKRSRGEAKEIQ